MDASVPISASTWLAARISGEKVGERPADSVEGFVKYISRMGRKADVNIRQTLENAARPKQTRESAAHTAPIYVTVAGTPPISEQNPARQIAKARLDLLDDLANRLADANLRDMARFPGSGDGVSMEDLRRSRGDLLQAIRKAREVYQKIMKSGER